MTEDFDSDPPGALEASIGQPPDYQAFHCSIALALFLVACAASALWWWFRS